MRRYGGDLDRVKREMMSEPEKYGPSLVLNSDELPFDV